MFFLYLESRIIADNDTQFAGKDFRKFTEEYKIWVFGTTQSIMHK
jgi:hypothetical protein